MGDFCMEKDCLPGKRLVVVFIGILILMAALAFRLYQIQVIEGPIYAAMARTQQRIALSGVDSRGEICDRNGEPLTGSEWQYVYLIRKDRMDPEAERLIEECGGRERMTSNEKYRIFSSDRYEKKVSEKLRSQYGAYIIEMPRRYEEDQVAKHLIGTIDDVTGKGLSGLELAYDDWLTQRDTVLYGVADAANRILPGYEIQNKEERVCRLITTVDKTLQKHMEDMVSESKYDIVIADVDSGEVLAILGKTAIDDVIRLDTPILQLTQWTRTLAKGGMGFALSVVKALEDDSGTNPVPKDEEKRVIPLEAVEQYEKYFKRMEELPDWDYRGTWIRSSEGIWFSAMIPGQEPRFTMTIGVSDIALKKDRQIQEKIVKLFQYTLEHLESEGEEGAYSSS